MGRDGPAADTSPETAESDIRATLAAVALDLDRSADLLDQVAREHLDTTLPAADVLLSVLASPRGVEARAVADRIGRMLAHEPTPGRPFPAGLDAAGLEPAP